MTTKFIFVLCAQVLFIQSIVAQRNKGAIVTGNFYVDNNIYLAGGSSSGSSAFGLGKASSALGLGKSSSSLSLGKTSSGILGGRNVGVSGLSNFNIISSGPLLVTSISPIGPSGLAVASENAIQGNLAVIGQLPYLSAVAFDGALPTAGSGVATCGCGDGNVGIVSEGVRRPPLLY